MALAAAGITFDSTIEIEKVKPNPNQRAIRQYRVEYIADKMRNHGYNASYPITVQPDFTIIDGGHRIAAAKLAGIIALPYIVSTEPPIQHALRCNLDGADTEPDDVFDLADLCYSLSEQGWTGQQIADELGWSQPQVTYYANIRKLLHPLAWNKARQLTKNPVSLNADDDDVVKPELTIVNWRETHFRALLKHLPCPNGDHAMMRAQVRAVHDIIDRANQKDKRFGATQKTVTARWIGEVAEQYAWHVKLARHMQQVLVERVGTNARVRLLRNIYNGVYGNRDDEKSLEKFDTACRNLNEKALGVVLYHDDAFQRIPLLADKSISLVVTDPPYNVTDHEWDKIGTDNEFLQFMRDWLSAIRPKLTDDYHLFLFCDSDYAASIESILRADNWPLKSRVIWSNRSLPSGRQVDDRFVSTWQMIFHCGTHSLNWSPQWSDERFDVQVFAAPNANTSDGGWHPTPKPQKLIEHLVSLGSKAGDTVLDPFGGGGTTGAASSTIGQRQCLIIEKSDEFCASIEERLGIKREAS